MGCLSPNGLVIYSYHWKGGVMTDTSVQSTVRRCLREFLDSTGRAGEDFGENTNLTRGLGFSSDEGIDFVLELCDALRIELPEDFNPFIHESRNRGRLVSEMIKQVESYVSQAGSAA